jgi:hypothetical protein
MVTPEAPPHPASARKCAPVAERTLRYWRCRRAPRRRRRASGRWPGRRCRGGRRPAARSAGDRGAPGPGRPSPIPARRGGGQLAGESGGPWPTRAPPDQPAIPASCDPLRTPGSRPMRIAAITRRWPLEAGHSPSGRSLFRGRWSRVWRPGATANGGPPGGSDEEADVREYPQGVRAGLVAPVRGDLLLAGDGDLAARPPWTSAYADECRWFSDTQNRRRLTSESLHVSRHRAASQT